MTGDAAWDSASDAGRRLTLLAATRERDPAAARDLLEQRLASLPGDERAGLVAALRAGLSAEDETVLEVARTDRRQDVRRAATDLLVRLPRSRAARRLEEIARPLIDTKGRLRASLAVTLPALTPELEAAGSAAGPRQVWATARGCSANSSGTWLRTAGRTGWASTRRVSWSGPSGATRRGRSSRAGSRRRRASAMRHSRGRSSQTQGRGRHRRPGHRECRRRPHGARTSGAHRVGRRGCRSVGSRPPRSPLPRAMAGDPRAGSDRGSRPFAGRPIPGPGRLRPGPRRGPRGTAGPCRRPRDGCDASRRGPADARRCHRHDPASSRAPRGIRRPALEPSLHLMEAAMPDTMPTILRAHAEQASRRRAAPRSRASTTGSARPAGGSRRGPS